MVAGRGAVILAAGASQRMGTPKALLPWAETTLLESALHQARLARVDHLVVVLGPATRHLEGALGGARVALNLEPETGRSASIRIGSQALPDQLTAVVVQSVDQPCSAEVMLRLFDALAGKGKGEVDVAVPCFEGHHGHPVCFAGRLLSELRSVTEEGAGLRSVVRGHASRLVAVPVDDPLVMLNLNDPQAYAAARLAAGYA